MNNELFQSLPADLQKVLVDAGKETARYTRQLGAEADAKLADVMAQEGIEVNEADVKSFVDLSKPIWQTIASENKFQDAGDIMDQIAALAD